MERFAEIILPLAVPGTFSYAVPAGMDVEPGQRVVVPFGPRRSYSGLVMRVHTERPLGRSARPIEAVLDEAPVVHPHQLALWERIREHYLCTPGEVMIAAMPAALVLTSETALIAGPNVATAHPADARRAFLLGVLEQRHRLTLGEAADILQVKDPIAAVKRLLEEGALTVAEEIGERFKPRMVRLVEQGPEARSEEQLHAWFDRLEKAPKQLHLLMRFIELSRCLTDAPREVRREELLSLAGATPAHLKPLLEKGVLQEAERPADAAPAGAPDHAAIQLSPAQQAALQAVRDGMATHDQVLLRGVTASGKTELYATLIEEQVRTGKQVLYLLPEIALTTQVVARLRARFGEQATVFHSRVPQRERTELWLRMLREPAAHPIVIGARSALFLPYQRLGLVVIDEEHDPSYKQQEPAPRYNARDMALVLAGIHGAKALLGSATPSMESLYNARSGKFGYAELLERYGDATLPAIERVDLGDAQRRKAMRGHFSLTLLEAVQRAIERREQAIIFQNRRGYVPVWQCETCGWVPQCDHCDVSLTYHKRDHDLRCHYCGRTYPPPARCGSCGGPRLRMLGFGTEKIEEELAEFLPEARVLRMDQDTTRGRHALERILNAFAEGQADVLVGTQMVTKGLDFERVSVVGILNADAMLRFPDLRAHERAFQLMAQVAGRSGRSRSPGTVYIQAREVHHPVLDLVCAHDNEGMYRRELEQRRAHGYPPFTRLVQLTVKHRDEQRVQDAAQALGAELRPLFGPRVLGPEAPPVARIRDKHLRTLLLKLRREGYQREKAALSDAIDRVFGDPRYARVQLVIDVDPM
ncbi:MAG: primosomal protein N' [Flavobacteriales bacterium]|nr:primosomal protein N' [Flavobacteriales bacterium]